MTASTPPARRNLPLVAAFVLFAAAASYVPFMLPRHPEPVPEEEETKRFFTEEKLLLCVPDDLNHPELYFAPDIQKNAEAANLLSRGYVVLLYRDAPDKPYRVWSTRSLVSKAK